MALMNKDLVEITRAIALAHELLKGGLRYTFVARYLGDDRFEKLYNKYQPYDIGFVLRCSVMIVVTVSLPYVYGNTIMEYPCEKQHAQFGNNTGIFKKLDCDAQDTMKSTFSLILAPIIILIRGALGGLFMFGKGVGCACVERLAQHMYHMEHFVGAQIWKLKYHKNPSVFGWAASCYFLLLAEMAVVSVYLRSGVAVVVGIGVGHIFLQLANIVLAPSHAAISLIDGKLEAWTCNVASCQFLRRLGEVTIDSVSVTAGDLEALQLSSHGSLCRLFQDVRKSVFPRYNSTRMKHTVHWNLLLLKTVIFSEGDLLVPCVVGSNDFDSPLI